MKPDPDRSTDVISEHLEAIAEHLGYEVIGPWLYKHAKDIQKWRRLAAKYNRSIWKRAPAPISMFIMLANVNRRCYEYPPPEQPKTWHLKPFQKARENALRHVRIFWGQGVIKGAVQSLHGQCVPDMFEHPGVVYKDQDILQGNRANIMAPWWLDDPDRRTDPSQTRFEHCDFLLGLYSPVRNAFTAGDLRRLMGARNHVALQMLYDSIVHKNLEDIKTKLKETLAKRGRPYDWPTLAILLYEHNFLQILGCEVSGNKRNPQRHFLVCPHYFRWKVLKAQSTSKPIKNWHPITSKHTQWLKYDYDQGSLILRYSGGTQRIQQSSAKREVENILKLSPFEAQELERQLQYACYGLSLGDDQLPNQYPQLLALASRPEVKSLTIVRTTAPPSAKRFPIYPAELSVGPCEEFDPNRNTPSDSKPQPEILVHVEAYCDPNGNPKPWIQEAESWVKQEAPPGAVPPVKVESHTLTLYLETDRNLGHPTIWRLTEQCLKDHAEDVLNNTFHSDAEINAAIAFYISRDWSHDGIENRQAEYSAAIEWLGIKQADPDSVKALFMNANPTRLRIAALSAGQRQMGPRKMSKTVLSAACRRLGIKLSIGRRSEITEVALPVVPGIVFLVALRNLMYRLEYTSNTPQATLSRGPSNSGGWSWTLKIQNVVPGILKALGQTTCAPHATRDAYTSIKKSATSHLSQGPQLARELRERLQYFEGTETEVVHAEPSLAERCLLLKWETGKW